MDKQIPVYPFNGLLLCNDGNRLIINLTIWITLKNIMLSERSQIQNSMYSKLPFININVNLSDGKQTSDFLGPGIGDENLLQEVQDNLFRIIKMAQTVKNPCAMQETWVQSLGQKDPLEKGMAAHSEFLPGEFHRQRSLVSYSPWGVKELDTTDRLTLTFCILIVMVVS